MSCYKVSGFIELMNVGGRLIGTIVDPVIFTALCMVESRIFTLTSLC